MIKNLITVSQRMSRSLFLLISLISSYDIYSKEYTVKDGDTLYSIALKAQVPLLDIYNSNKLLGLSPNNIKQGDVIYIPIVLDDDYSNYCYFYSHKLEINLNSTVNEILSRCFKYIEDSLDISIFQGEQNINF